jgi:hypothetical protein
MKSLFTLLMLCGLFFFSCKSDTNSNSDNNSATTNPDGSTHVPSSPSSLMLGLWHFAVVVGDQPVADKYKGRWIDIKRDDTFTSGLYLEENNSGTWSYNPETKIISLKYKNDEGLAPEWETQGGGESIIWKGSTPNNKTGLQIKMVVNLEGKRPAQ